MKKILTTILILISLTTIGQDKQLFNYINEYRVVNDRKPLKWSDKLVKISIGQNNKNIKDKSLSHSSHNSYENCLMGATIASSKVEQKDFIKFTKKHFNYEYNVYNDMPHEELLNLTKMYMVYIWHMSPGHKDNLLRYGVNYCSAESYIGNDFKFFDGGLKVNGKTYTYKKITTHYSVDYYATMNLR
jgi:hypothetical protein